MSIEKYLPPFDQKWENRVRKYDKELLIELFRHTLIKIERLKKQSTDKQTLTGEFPTHSR